VRLLPAGLLAVAAALLAGCGGSGTPDVPNVLERSYGSGAGQVWTFSPEGRKPASLVVFLHGLGGVEETTPALHRPWLRHLAEAGSIVVYPRYEVRPGEPGGLKHAIDGIRLAASRAGAGDAPVVMIGYSRGGGMAVEYTGIARAVGVVPKAVLAVFPALLDPVLDLSVVAPKTRFVFLVGDKDVSVGFFGANRLVDQLHAAGYPDELVTEEVVHSTKDFQATHLSVLEDSPGARAAFWDRADRLIASVIDEA
jgi:acetyl esterase/lipase